MKKRLLSLFLALVMLLSLVPATAFADSSDSDWVTITDVKVNGDQITVKMDMRTTADGNLVFAGYSESGKLLASRVFQMEATQEDGIEADFDCEGLSDIGSLATVKVFALGKDNRLLGMPYETHSNATHDEGSWWGLWWEYDNGSLTVTYYGNDPATIPGTGELSGQTYPWEKYKDQITTLNLVNIDEVGSKAFKGYRALETVNADAYLSVGTQGFSNCANLKTVNARISGLGVSAFQGCSSLEELDVRQANNIGSKALKETAIRKIVLQNPEVNLTIDAFGGMENLVYVSLPDGMTGVPGSRFVGAKNLQVVAGLENVTDIGEEAFQGTGMNAYTSKVNVAIGKNAFAQCANLRTVNIPLASTLSERAFAQANIASLTLNAAEISEEAFTLDGEDDEEFAEMAYVELIGTVSVADKAFWRRTIGDLYIPATLTTLADDAFGNTEIRVLHLPKDWNLDTLAAKAEEPGWQYLLDAETILDFEGNVLKGETEGDGGDIGDGGDEDGEDGGNIVISEETTPAAIP